MRCEVCGRKIHGSPTRALIEGAKLTVCVECSKHGKIIYDEPAPIREASKLAPAPFVPKKKPATANVEITQEVVEGYHSKIRQAREKLGLSHEELGKKINEKASVLSKLETGKMTPNNQLVAKLEHALKIKLLVPITKEKVTELPKSPNRELTLGDLMQFEKKGGEEPTERKQS
ncbi:MAG: multiprotein bridging factor aMBF1 [Candidatus Bathyarchaeota archaeon]|nr:multiprotein bridging factor aMBF1 [Candidatus Bathyarchaeota archaeon]